MTNEIKLRGLEEYSASEIYQRVLQLPEKEQAEAISLIESLAGEAAWARMGERSASFDSGCLLWLTKYTATEDNHWLHKGTPPVAPFPQKEYFAVLLRYILDSPRIFIPKSREMMTSWAVCGYIAWMAQWNEHVEWILQTEKESKAKELVNYCRILYRRQRRWMQQRVKVAADNASVL